jgi:predicted  nucleic acid-binding Zn-ribbon protein
MQDLATRMMSIASQENNDGEEFDLLMDGYHEIRKLEKEIIELKETNTSLEEELQEKVEENLALTNRISELTSPDADIQSFPSIGESKYFGDEE